MPYGTNLNEDYARDFNIRNEKSPLKNLHLKQKPRIAGFLFDFIYLNYQAK
jgi:hypothetical protein